MEQVSESYSGIHSQCIVMFWWSGFFLDGSRSLRVIVFIAKNFCDSCIPSYIVCLYIPFLKPTCLEIYECFDLTFKARILRDFFYSSSTHFDLRDFLFCLNNA